MNISTQSTVNLYTFPESGAPKVVSFRKWRKRFLAYAQGLFPEYNFYGLLGYVVTEAEFQRIVLGPNPGVDAAPYQAFIVPQPPGPIPAAANAQPIYANAQKLYSSFQLAVSALKNYMLSSLDMSIHPMFEDPEYGTINLTPAVILQRLDALFLVMSPDDSMIMKASMCEPFPDGPDKPLRAFIQHHTEIHRMFELSGNIINNRDKYEYLRNAMVHIPFYATVIDQYVFTTPVAQTYDGLAAVLLQAELNRPAVVHTGNHGYANRTSTLGNTSAIMQQEQRIQYFCPKCLRYCNEKHPRCMSTFKPGDTIPKAPTK
jgi:hypothetical protein